MSEKKAAERKPVVTLDADQLRQVSGGVSSDGSGPLDRKTTKKAK